MQVEAIAALIVTQEHQLTRLRLRLAPTKLRVTTTRIAQPRLGRSTTRLRLPTTQRWAPLLPRLHGR